jgi:TolB-like protein/Tfp pilus assembly protein PilF
MASLIPGYEYDIFISYRQKDNKGDKWVSEFVDALKTELESTFKEDITVYFDINPHDGLLETHDVDASLKDKLKCLIFIPIISRTYCDPKSFAWEHEFKVFVEQASQDQFGLKVKLPGGNIASRVLPVRIYDLDTNDIKLYESILGGVIRGVDFIYNSSGVNRPLRANEDHPQDNLNKTYYRDQINKVANAAKEIFTSLKKKNQHEDEFGKEVVITKPGSTKKLKPKIILASAIALLLILLGYFFIPKLLESPKLIEKSIAVLPFRNLSNDTAQIYFCDGFMEEILDNLQKVKGFTVRSRTSSDQYRNTQKPITAIGNELNVNYLIEGSVGREGNNLKIWVQLIDSKADKHIWSNEYLREMTIDQIFSIQSEIAKAVALELKAVLTPDEIKNIEKRPTENIDAYNDFLLGDHYAVKRTEKNLLQAIVYYESAISKDPKFALAYAGIATAYMSLVFDANWLPEGAYHKAREAVLKALDLDNDLSEAHTVLGSIKLHYDWDIKAAEKEFDTAIKLNPNNSSAYSAYATLLDIACDFNEALERFKQALALDPNSEDMRFWYGYYLYQAFKTDTAILILKKGVEDDPFSARKHYILGYVYLESGENIKAEKELEIATELDPIPQPYYLYLGVAYNRAGKPGETKRLLEKLNALEKENNKVSFGKAVLLAELGEADQSIYWLKKAYEERHQYLLYLKKSGPIIFSSIHSDSRFLVIYHKIWPDN